MKRSTLKEEMEKIEIPPDLHHRSKMGIQQAKLEERHSERIIGKKRVWGGIVSAAVLVSAIIALNDSSLASSVRGYFRDIVNWKNEVVDTQYSQATDEIKVEANSATVQSETIIVPVTVTLQDITKPPYSTIEVLTFGDFEVVGSSGESLPNNQITVQAASDNRYEFDIKDRDKLLSEVKSPKANERVFQANLLLDAGFFNNNERFTLKIRSFFGQKKADSPLKIEGDWKVAVSVKRS
jgi:archaellum component FlaF (FlaF/FlaG flagellin family)